MLNVQRFLGGFFVITISASIVINIYLTSRMYFQIVRAHTTLLLRFAATILGLKISSIIISSNNDRLLANRLQYTVNQTRKILLDRQIGIGIDYYAIFNDDTKGRPLPSICKST